jgi:hypothetical protein
MKRWGWIFSAVVLLAIAASAQQAADPASQPAPSQPEVKAVSTTPGLALAPQTPRTPVSVDQVVDAVIEREHALIQFLHNRTPLVETYLQNLQPDTKMGAIPKEDHYFLGRLDLADIDRRDYLTKESSFQRTLMGGVTKLFRIQYQPMGFSWMIFADRQNFDRAHYDFHYVHREFLGEVRTLVFEVTPKKNAGSGLFQGTIWVEDQDYNIVRLNGTYVPRPKNAFYFHMDSWRLNLVPGYWIPAYIYSEEGDFSYGAKDKMAFKAQTRIWGYDLKKNGKSDELTQISVEDTVKDVSAAAADASPLEAQRQWQQQAEDNVVERLQNAGLLAPEGDVDKILQTVVNNLQITNNIELPRPVRTRVLLTSPLETFSVGNTIIVSRGLIDTLPDEGSLAMVLSHELAHIVLGHNLGSKFAFNDRMLFMDESTYSNFGFRHVPEEETSADKKALELLKSSPYSQKMETAGLFLRELNERAPELSALLTAHLGNKFVDSKGQIERMAPVMTAAPALDANKLDQIAALPLGGRVKLNPWNDQVELTKSAPVAITSARDKMPFEVTPFYPRLNRLTSGSPTGPATSAANTTPAK